MAYDPAFGDWMREHFADLGPLEIKRMFGAGAVYSNGLLFALLDDGVVWLKGDEESIPQYEASGSRQFTYAGNDGEVMNLGYWSLPETAVDDTDEAIKWARIAIGAALRKASAKKVRKPKVRPAP